MITYSELWDRPSTPHPMDDEFDTNTIDSSWAVRNETGGTAGSFGMDQIDTYDTTFISGNVLRAVINSDNRRSWLLIQSPNTKDFYIHKPYSFPTNVLIIARMKFNQYYTTMVSNDRSIGIALAEDNGGIPNRSNAMEILLQESDGTVQSQFTRWEDPGIFAISNTTNATIQGQALEYVAIHKIGSNYHGWIGTASGNWIYMGVSHFLSVITPAHVCIRSYNNSTSNPGVGVSGVDFVRFIETDNFLF